MSSWENNLGVDISKYSIVCAQKPQRNARAPLCITEPPPKSGTEAPGGARPGHPRLKSRSPDWVSVKELELSYHNMDIYQILWFWNSGSLIISVNVEIYQTIWLLRNLN